MKSWYPSHFIPINMQPGWKVYGNSCSSAMVQVEKALDQQEIALGIFLYIEGAFNNTS
jgi:hypothetical protein